MVGRKFENLYPPKNVPRQETVLEVYGMSTKSLLKDINLSARKGEIVGLAGLVGSGRTEISRCLFGLDRMTAGRIVKNGREIAVRHPADAMRQGIGLVPESRKEQGAILSRPIRENMTLSNLKRVCYRFGILNYRRERALSEQSRQRLSIKWVRWKILFPASAAGTSKSGDRQMAGHRMRSADPDEPTRGVDVGAKVEIYNVIHELAERATPLL